MRYHLVGNLILFQMTPFTCIFENNCECYPQLTTFSEHGGHFGRHLGFWEKLQGDFRGVLVCDSTQFSGPILKNIACYGTLPPFCHFWANTLGLLINTCTLRVCGGIKKKYIGHSTVALSERNQKRDWHETRTSRDYRARNTCLEF